MLSNWFKRKPGSHQPRTGKVEEATPTSQDTLTPTRTYDLDDPTQDIATDDDTNQIHTDIKHGLANAKQSAVVAYSDASNYVSIDAESILMCLPSSSLSDSIESILEKYILNSDFNFTFSKEEILPQLSRGHISFSLGDIVSKIPHNIFAVDVESQYNLAIELPLSDIVAKIPPAWMVIPNQDTKAIDALADMDDLFVASDDDEEEEEPAAPVPVTAEPEPAQEAPAGHDVSDPDKTPIQPVKPQPDQALDQSPDAVGAAVTVTEEQPAAMEITSRPMEKAVAGRMREPAPEAHAVAPDKEPTTLSDQPALSSPAAVTEPVTSEPQLSPGTETSDVSDSSHLSQVPVVTKAPKARAVSDTSTRDEELRHAAAVFLGQTTPRQRTFRSMVGARDLKIQPGASGEIWQSQAPNGININRASVSDLCLLRGIGPQFAQRIIAFRESEGPLTNLNDLLRIKGLGRQTFQDMTMLTTRTSLRDAELYVNAFVQIQDAKVSLPKITMAAARRLQFDGMLISGTDGLVLAAEGTDEMPEELLERLAAVAPQLYKRALRSLTQGSLPMTDLVMFQFRERAVSISGSDQIFCAGIHPLTTPGATHLEEFKRLTRALVWYCSYRAVI